MPISIYPFFVSPWPRLRQESPTDNFKEGWAVISNNRRGLKPPFCVCNKGGGFKKSQKGRIGHVQGEGKPRQPRGGDDSASHQRQSRGGVPFPGGPVVPAGLHLGSGADDVDLTALDVRHPVAARRDLRVHDRDAAL